MIVWVPVPTTVGVYVTGQVAVPATVPADKLQLAAGVKVPVPLLVNETVPVGVVGEVFVSVTVAVHVVAELTATELGTHATTVVVA